MCGSIGVGEDGGNKMQSVCPNVTLGEDVEASDRRFSPGEEINQILREELGSLNITSTPIRAAWPIYTKRRNSVLGKQDKPHCKAAMFDVVSGSGTVGGRELPRMNVSKASEGVPDSFVKSGGFSTLKGIAQHHADERVVGARIDEGGEGMVRVPSVDELLGQKEVPKERTKC